MFDKTQDLPLQTGQSIESYSIMLSLIVHHEVGTILNTSFKKRKKLFTLINLGKHFGLPESLRQSKM